MSKDQDLQYMIFWSIAGPFILVLSLFLAARLLVSLGASNSDSWVGVAGVVLYYSSYFGAMLVAHVFAFFGLLGLLTLPGRAVKHKGLTLVTCLAALLAATPLLAALYFGFKL